MIQAQELSHFTTQRPKEGPESEPSPQRSFHSNALAPLNLGTFGATRNGTFPMGTHILMMDSDGGEARGSDMDTWEPEQERNKKTGRDDGTRHGDLQLPARSADTCEAEPWAPPDNRRTCFKRIISGQFYGNS